MTTSHLTVDLNGAPTSVTVVRSTRRRRTIAVGVAANGIRVQAPTATTDAYLSTVLKQRARWIAHRLESLAARPPVKEPGDGGVVPYRGRDLALRVVPGQVRRTIVRLVGDELNATIPETVPAHERPAATRAALVAWYRDQAAVLLSELVDQWSAVAGLAPARVLVRNQRRRWGSCGPDGTIRLNWRLILVEPSLAEYVVVHELAHLRHRHHQAAFWAEVARLIPDHRERRRKLNAARALDYFLG